MKRVLDDDGLPAFDRREPAPADAIPPRVRAIVADIERRAMVGQRDIFSRSQRPHIAAARWWIWARIRDEIRINHRPPSYPLIGHWFGRDHTTVMYGCRRFQGQAADVGRPA